MKLYNNPIRIFRDATIIHKLLLTEALAADRPIITGNNLPEQKGGPAIVTSLCGREISEGGLLLKLCRHPKRSRFISHQNCDDNAQCLTVLMWQIVTSKQFFLCTDATNRLDLDLAVFRAWPQSYMANSRDTHIVRFLRISKLDVLVLLFNFFPVRLLCTNFTTSYHSSENFVTRIFYRTFCNHYFTELLCKPFCYCTILLLSS